MIICKCNLRYSFILGRIKITVEPLHNGNLEDRRKWPLWRKHNEVQGLTFRKKSWGQLASTFSFLVARTSILVAKNYLQEKIEYNILKVF